MTTTIQRVRSCIALTLALVLTACATTMGRDFSEEYARQIKAGETTKAQVLERLGRPPLRKGTKEDEIWTYAYYTGPGVFRWVAFSREDPQYGLGDQKRLVVVFSGDVVKSSTFTREIPQEH